MDDEKDLDMPASTSKALAEVDASLGTSIMNWMRKHGKMVRPKLPKDQLQQLEECFHLMDQDGSGSIDVGELGAAFKLLGIHLRQSEILEIVKEVDDDGSGDLGVGEFLEIMTNTMHRLAEDQSGHHQPTVPFGLVATAYRRKRLLEGIMTSDKEVRQQLQQLNEKQAQEAMLAQAALADAPKAVSLMTDAKLKASVFGRRRMRQLGKLQIDHEVMAALGPEEQKTVMATMARAALGAKGRSGAGGSPGRLKGELSLGRRAGSVPGLPSGHFANSATHHLLMETPTVFELKFMKKTAVSRMPLAAISAGADSRRGCMVVSPSPGKKAPGGGGPAAAEEDEAEAAATTGAPPAAALKQPRSSAPAANGGGSGGSGRPAVVLPMPDEVQPPGGSEPRTGFRSTGASPSFSRRQTRTVPWSPAATAAPPTPPDAAAAGPEGSSAKPAGDSAASPAYNGGEAGRTGSGGGLLPPLRSPGSR